MPRELRHMFVTIIVLGKVNLQQICFRNINNNWQQTIFVSVLTDDIAEQLALYDINHMLQMSHSSNNVSVVLPSAPRLLCPAISGTYLCNDRSSRSKAIDRKDVRYA